MDEIIEAVVSRPQPAPEATAPSAAPHHVFLIDGSGFIFRAYFARARTADPVFQRKSDGMVTEVVTLFSNMLDKYRRETDADHMAVIFDASGSSFRNRIYSDYKANRREMPDDLRPQLGHVRRAAAAFDICQIELPDFEADDLIATYARHAVEAGAKVTILSSDKDLMQLVGPDVTMRDPMTDRPIAEAEVREKFGVGPDKVIDVQALCGDSTDNVPGVPGIGVKTAAELINTYGDLETLLARADEIKQPKRRAALLENEAKARLSKELVKLDDDVPLPCPLVGAQSQAIRPGEALSVPRRDGIARAQVAHRPSPRHHRAPPDRAQRAGDSGGPALYRTAHLRSRRHDRRSRPLDRRGIPGGGGCDLARGKRSCRHPAGARRDGARSGAGARRLRPARASHGRCPRPRPGRQAVAGSGHRPAAAAARGSGGSQDRPRRQERGAHAVALWHRADAS